jgi:hypothetical protein
MGAEVGGMGEEAGAAAMDLGEEVLAVTDLGGEGLEVTVFVRPSQV